jgi:serine/threonine-protein kinase
VGETGRRSFALRWRRFAATATDSGKGDDMMSVRSTALIESFPSRLSAGSVSYQIVEQLASSGMAETFLARDASANDSTARVVLKQLRREHVSNEELARTFLDEAQLSARLQHRNIARVLEVGEVDGAPFFTMEHVHGDSVRKLLQRAIAVAGRLPIGCVLTVIAGAAAGLRHAHELGVVHHDISPSHLMVSVEGTVKIIDFATAKAAHRIRAAGNDVVASEVGYRSPEQCKNQTVDWRTDLFSLGIVMWEMLTGASLFRHNTDALTIAAITRGSIVPPSHVRASVPPAVDAIVQRLLALPCEARFQTAAEVVDAIETAAAKTFTKLSPAPLGRLVRDLLGGAGSNTAAETVVVSPGDSSPTLVANRAGNHVDATATLVTPVVTWSTPSEAVARNEPQAGRVLHATPLSARRELGRANSLAPPLVSARQWAVDRTMRGVGPLVPRHAGSELMASADTTVVVRRRRRSLVALAALTATLAVGAALIVSQMPSRLDRDNRVPVLTSTAPVVDSSPAVDAAGSIDTWASSKRGSEAIAPTAAPTAGTSARPAAPPNGGAVPSTSQAGGTPPGTTARYDTGAGSATPRVAPNPQRRPQPVSSPPPAPAPAPAAAKRVGDAAASPAHPASDVVIGDPFQGT